MQKQNFVLQALTNAIRGVKTIQRRKLTAAQVRDKTARAEMLEAFGRAYNRRPTFGELVKVARTLQSARALYLKNKIEYPGDAEICEGIAVFFSSGFSLDWSLFFAFERVENSVNCCIFMRDDFPKHLF